MRRVIALILAALASGAYADGDTLTARLADPGWNGETIPQGQHCARFGGHGATPALRVERIPAAANALVMEYSDKSYKPMDNGGHGKIGYRISDRAVVVPSVPGHSFALPDGFFLVEAQRAPTWDKAGAYLPPCSGGKGNSYAVTVKAVQEAEGNVVKVLAQTTLVMGSY